ncbi:carbohydrate ABC transporter permease [Sulfoacidibacillus ferrooxidans]|uniref:L-arabinose transport system permease protein AraQ n=1 Tax=Sulfoacidibacillus ferrooxidans TaxID=2005001 RepID=A0A9X2ADJ5_9BACL|nr:L-arabinose transport system permease protein AraQ [Sulfoacidibacillus ferrooxidans]
MQMRLTFRQLSRALLYILLILLAMLYLVPIYVVVITSLKDNAAISLSQMWNLPLKPSFSSIVSAWDQLGPNFGNSIELAIPATIISSLIGSLNGYALSKWKFKGSSVIFFIILFGMFIPYQSVLIPLLRVLDAMGLYNTILGLIMVHSIYGIPITTLIFKNYYSAIPNEIIESGAIDGVGYWGIFRHIILPLSIPGFVVTGIWQFTQVWNNFLFAVSLTNPPNQPVTVALVNIAGSQTVQWNVQMASALLASLPTLIVYIFLGKYFVRGLLAGSVKG